MGSSSHRRGQSGDRDTQSSRASCDEPMTCVLLRLVLGYIDITTSTRSRARWASCMVHGAVRGPVDHHCGYLTSRTMSMCRRVDPRQHPLSIVYCRDSLWLHYLPSFIELGRTSQLSTLNSPLSTLDSQLSTLHSPLSTLRGGECHMWRRRQP